MNCRVAVMYITLWIKYLHPNLCCVFQVMIVGMVSFSQLEAISIQMHQKLHCTQTIVLEFALYALFIARFQRR